MHWVPFDSWIAWQAVLAVVFFLHLLAKSSQMITLLCVIVSIFHFIHQWHKPIVNANNFDTKVLRPICWSNDRFFPECEVFVSLKHNHPHWIEVFCVLFFLLSCWMVLSSPCTRCCCSKCHWVYIRCLLFFLALCLRTAPSIKSNHIHTFRFGLNGKPWCLSLISRIARSAKYCLYSLKIARSAKYCLYSLKIPCDPWWCHTCPRCCGTKEIALVNSVPPRSEQKNALVDPVYVWMISFIACVTFGGTLAFQSPSHQVFRISINAYKDKLVSTILVESSGHFWLPNTFCISILSCLEEKSTSICFSWTHWWSLEWQTFFFRLAGFRKFLDFIHKWTAVEKKKCMEMAEREKEPQASAWFEMQGQMTLSLWRVQREERE